MLLQDAAKVLAKSLLRNRAAVTKMHQLKANLQAVSLKISVRDHWQSVLPPAFC